MTLFRLELKRNRISLIIWSAIIAFMLFVSVLLFPEMKAQIGDLNEMMAGMGELSSALGMDNIDLGDFLGYFGSECGDTLGLGGALFAAILGISALAKEEKDQTAEFLLTHPVSRARVVTEKLCSVFAEITILNIIVAAATCIGIVLIGERPDAGVTALILLSYYLLQIEIAFLCFGLSAFIRRGGIGIGLGVSFGMYFLNIIANLTEDAKFLKYITPFGYASGTDIVANSSVNAGYLSVGILLTVVGAAVAYIKYTKKDIT